MYPLRGLVGSEVPVSSGFLAQRHTCRVGKGMPGDPQTLDSRLLSPWAGPTPCLSVFADTKTSVCSLPSCLGEHFAQSDGILYFLLTDREPETLALCPNWRQTVTFHPAVGSGATLADVRLGVNTPELRPCSKPTEMDQVACGEGRTCRIIFFFLKG